MALIHIFYSPGFLGLLTPLRQRVGLRSPETGISSLPLSLQLQVITISLLITTSNWNGIASFAAEVTSFRSRTPEFRPVGPIPLDSNTPCPFLPLDDTENRLPYLLEPQFSTVQNTSDSMMAFSSLMTSSLIILVVFVASCATHPILKELIAHMAPSISARMVPRATNKTNTLKKGKLYCKIEVDGPMQKSKDSPRLPPKRGERHPKKQAPRRPPLTPYTFDPIISEAIDGKEECKETNVVEPSGTPSSPSRLELPLPCHHPPDSIDYTSSHVNHPTTSKELGNPCRPSPITKVKLRYRAKASKRKSATLSDVRPSQHYAEKWESQDDSQSTLRGTPPGEPYTRPVSRLGFHSSQPMTYTRNDMDSEGDEIESVHEDRADHSKDLYDWAKGATFLVQTVKYHKKIFGQYKFPTLEAIEEVFSDEDI